MKQFSREDIEDALDNNGYANATPGFKDAVIRKLFGQPIPEGFIAYECNGDSPVPDGVEVVACFDHVDRRASSDHISWLGCKWYQVLSIPTLTLDEVKGGDTFYHIDETNYPAVSIRSIPNCYQAFIIKNGGAYKSAELRNLALKWPDCLCDTYKEMFKDDH